MIPFSRMIGASCTVCGETNVNVITVASRKLSLLEIDIDKFGYYAFIVEMKSIRLWSFSVLFWIGF